VNRTTPVLGCRCRSIVAVDQLEDLLGRLAQLADDLSAVARLGANPVIVTPTGALVAEAQICIADPDRRHTRRLC
jgi:hypothetical protein